VNTLSTGRKRAQRAYPIAEEDRCEHCGSIKTLQRHHIDRDPMNNAPDNIALLCVDCHAKQHRTIQPATCQICGLEFQPKRSRRATLCGAAQCLSEKGRRSAALRWA